MAQVKDWLETQKTDDQSIVLLLIKGYFLLTFLCFLFLILPCSQTETNSLIDHLFFAVSIVSTTGLAPTDFGASYNLFGQFISLIFIQLGGIGYMAMSSFIILKQFKRLPSISARLLKLEFNLPQKYPFRAFIFSVFIFTILIEIIGTIVLYYGFICEPVDNPMWQAIFHSVSAFCTAGFSLSGDSLIAYQSNPLITNTIMVLSLLGSIGFIVLLDFWLRIIQRRKYITLTSKIIIVSTFAFILFATIAIYTSDSTLHSQGWLGIKIALFQSVSAHTTAGFNNWDLNTLSVPGVFILTILMIIGASPAGTGGGIKTTSITALFAVLLSILRRRKHVTFFGKEIPASNIYLAVASTIFYGIILIIGTWGLLMIDGDKFTLDKVLFEASSALSTVGISTGITGQLSTGSKLVIALLMFIGRLGVLTFGLALISEAPLLRNSPQSEDIAI